MLRRAASTAWERRRAAFSRLSLLDGNGDRGEAGAERPPVPRRRAAAGPSERRGLFVGVCIMEIMENNEIKGGKRMWKDGEWIGRNEVGRCVWAERL